MNSMNSGVSAYQEDAVRRQEQAEKQTMSDMGNVPSKYHDGNGGPFPGPDAVGLAFGMIDAIEAPGPEQKAKVQRAEKRARKSAATAVDPTRVEFVTHGHDRLCIDCYWCRDGDVPTAPAFLQCYRPAVAAANGGTAPSCATARSDHFEHLSCGRSGLWFQDAIDQ